MWAESIICTCRNEDVTRSMYPPPDWYKTQSRSAETDTHSSWYGSESKINRVCDSMISALTRAGEIKLVYLLYLIFMQIGIDV